jgi:hypothetical protein
MFEQSVRFDRKMMPFTSQLLAPLFYFQVPASYEELPTAYNTLAARLCTGGSLMEASLFRPVL